MGQALTQRWPGRTARRLLWQGGVSALFVALALRAVDLGGLRDAIESSLRTPGVQLIVLRTDRRENLELHRKLGEAVAHALEPAGRS